jgi:replicative DNA helicase
MPLNSNYIESSLSDENIATTEARIVGTALFSHEAFLKLKTLCAYNEDTGMVENGFRTEYLNRVFTAIYIAWETIPGGETHVTTSVKSEFERIIQTWIADPSIGNGVPIGASDIEGMNLWVDTEWVEENYTYNQIRNILSSEVFTTWVERRLAERHINQIHLQKQQGAVGRTPFLRASRDFEEMDVGFDDDMPEPDRLYERRSSQMFYCGNDAIHHAMGTGFELGALTIIGAPRGNGKTVIAVQVAFELALQDVGVMMVSTEEPSHSLVPRFLTNYLEVPINELRQSTVMRDRERGQIIEQTTYGGIRADKFHEHEARINEFRDCVYAPNIRVVYCDKPPDEGVYTYMQRKYAKVQSSLGREPRMVIVDWIKGLLPTGAAMEGRHKYNEVAKSLALFSRRYNVHVILLCQLHESVKNHWPTQMTIAESKSLADEAHNFIGISAFTRAQTETESDSLYSNYQCFLCDKARNGRPGFAWVVREFNFQRFGPRIQFGANASDAETNAVTELTLRARNPKARDGSSMGDGGMRAETTQPRRSRPLTDDVPAHSSLPNTDISR